MGRKAKLHIYETLVSILETTPGIFIQHAKAHRPTQKQPQWTRAQWGNYYADRIAKGQEDEWADHHIRWPMRELESLVMQCLAHNPFIKINSSEPCDHSIETGTVENAIVMINRLMSLAITLILRNPNLSVTGFNRMQVLKLWREFFNWAIAVINLNPCPWDKSKRSRYEVFVKKRPNMQNIRILPISEP